MSSSITAVVIKNPFNIDDRIIRSVEYSHAKMLAAYINELCIEDKVDCELVVSVNGGIVPPERWGTTAILPGSYIAVCPVVGKGGDGGKNILGIVASIALSVVAMGAGSAASGGAWFGKGAMAVTSWGAAGVLAATAVMYVGGMLLSKLTPTASIDTENYGSSASTTYSWNKQAAISQQGGAVGLTYGTVRPTPQVLASHITSDGDKQYLNLLLCGGEGPVDGITNLRVDGNPIENYTDADVDIRLGTNDQGCISNFGDTFADQALNYELTTSAWATQQLAGNGNQGLEVTVEFPAGLYYIDSSGNTQSASVTISAEYRQVGAASWTPWLTDAEIVAASTSAVRRVYRIDDIASDVYCEVRMMCTGKSGTSNQYATRPYWTQLSGIVYDDFCRPGKVLIGIKALATEQLSGSMPEITWEQTRASVRVWTGSAYEEKAATNPAWAAYDMVHRCRSLKNPRDGLYYDVVFGAPAGRMVYQDFLTWATRCESVGLTCNYFLDAANDLWGALKEIEMVGRGKVVLKGTKFGAVFDGPKAPVQMFTMGNMIAGTFKEEFLATKDRANAIEITFNDKNQNYERTTVMVYSDDYDSSAVVKNPTQITMDAVDSWDQAYREARYKLRLNQYLLRTVSFEAAVDAIACQVGDCVLVQHDVPQWGFGGRILHASDASTITLDREVQLEPGTTYEVMVRISATDIMEKRTVAAVAEMMTTDVLTVTAPFSTLPTALDDVYAFGKANVSSKPFTVLKIDRSIDQARKISAVEYVEAVYEEEATVPVINYSNLDVAVDISSLSLGQETYTQKDGAVMSSIYASWTIPRGKVAKSYDVFISTDGITFAPYATAQAQSMVISGVKSTQTYFITVLARNVVGVYGEGKTESIVVTGKDTPPAAVSGFAVAEVAGGFLLTWQPNTEPDISGYNIWLGADNAGVDACSLIANRLMSTSHFVPVAVAGNYIFYISASDNSENQSDLTQLNASFTLPPAIEGFTATCNGDNIEFRWEGANGLYAEIRRGNSWEVGEHVHCGQGISCTYFFPVAGTHQFWIKWLDSRGNYSAVASFAIIQIGQSNNRNIVFSVDQVGSQDPWAGVKINTHVYNGGLTLDQTAIRGEHIVEVNLPDKVYARNWILSNIVGTSGNEMDWGSANFAWDSPEAGAAWLPDGDVTTASVKHQIARFVGLGTDVIEAFSLDETITGEQLETAAAEAVGVTYQDGRFRKGVFVGDGTQLSWNVSLPAAFSLVFVARHAIDIVDHIVYMSLTGPGGLLKVGYDPAVAKFYLADGQGNRNEVSLDFRTQDFVTFGLVQTATQRRFMVKSFSTGDAQQATQAFGPVGTISHLALYP